MLRPESAANVVLLTALVAFGPLSTDMYLPALPAIADSLDTNAAKVQLTLGVYMIGFAVGQLAHGPLSDRFGRRPVLLWGILLYLLAGIACALAPTVEWLIAARLLHGVGACTGPVLGRTIARDVYGRDHAAKVLAYMGMAMALAPMIAPILGGLLVTWFDWRSIFWALVAFAGLSWLLVAALLAETNRWKNPEATQPGRLIGNYVTLLGVRSYVGYVLTNAFVFGALFAFIAGSSFVFIDFLGLTEQQYSYCFSSSVIGFMSGSFLSARLTLRLGIDRLLRYGGAWALGAGLTMASLAWAGFDGVAAILLPTVALSAGVGVVMPNSMAGAVGPFPTMAGAASALFGFIQVAVAGTVSFLVGILHDGTQMPMVGLVALMTAASFAAYRLLVRPQPQAAGDAA